ncbi:transposase [Micromonospora sp. NPDC005707]|uniref:transposase n=1 Tax=Micromonospora sp. NPDC005707 TaxID=3157050 RepID=UPI0033F8185C
MPTSASSKPPPQYSSGQPGSGVEQGDQTSHRCRRWFPNPEALLRLAGAVLVEAHDEWQTGDSRYLAEGAMALITTPAPVVATTELAAA